jgi:hypothetical protein
MHILQSKPFHCYPLTSIRLTVRTAVKYLKAGTVGEHTLKIQVKYNEDIVKITYNYFVILVIFGKATIRIGQIKQFSVMTVLHKCMHLYDSICFRSPAPHSAIGQRAIYFRGFSTNQYTKYLLQSAYTHTVRQVN